MKRNTCRFLTATIGLVVVLLQALPTVLIKADEPKDEPKTTELFGDLNFEKGFLVVDGSGRLGTLRLQVPGLDNSNSDGDEPVWVLAQHNSRFDLTKGEIETRENYAASTTPGQRVALERNGQGELVLFLDVSTDKEYLAPRKNGEPWIHLLLVQDFPVGKRVSFGDVDSLVFSCDARVNDWKRLMKVDEFDDKIHATQASVYFAISNDNPESPDFRDYIWFGISFFDDRWEVQSQYVEIDGDPRTIGTGKLIYRLGEQKTIDDLMGGVNPYSKKWTHIEIDLARYVGAMLSAAQERGLLTQTNVSELKLSHFNYGWETPGTYDASLAIKNLSLRATFKE
ncbi:MAG: hypothetical protein J6X44_06595 [Thermoguttaceae bacterium]|nr:hypothetical protein [Thermoguttaceae bacterium]